MASEAKRNRPNASDDIRDEKAASGRFGRHPERKGGSERLGRLAGSPSGYGVQGQMVMQVRWLPTQPWMQV